ncbi:MAG: hypothetical protein GX800_07970 [Clostridiaceae bacterium]|nr:hypothetical protein [Clostridiaceae bacterium]
MLHRYLDGTTLQWKRNLPGNTPANPQIFYSIKVLDEAIEKHLQVTFALNEIDHKKQPILRTNNKGQVLYFTFNPYLMFKTNGRYCLIGNFDAYDNLTYARQPASANKYISPPYSTAISQLASLTLNTKVIQ